MPTIGVVVLSMQGMERLPECLDSVRWADRIVLWHAGAAGPAGDLTPFPSVVIKRVASVSDLARLSEPPETDWVLHLWGEERVEGELGEALRAMRRGTLASAPLGYRIPIRSRLLGCWVEGSLFGPSPALRLSRKVENIACGWWPSGSGEIRRYPALRRGWIGDYSASGLRKGMEQIQRMSDLWAAQLRDEAQPPNFMGNLLTPIRVFVRLLGMNAVFPLGFAGLTLSTLAAYATFLASAKVWEARNAGEKKA